MLNLSFMQFFSAGFKFAYSVLKFCILYFNFNFSLRTAQIEESTLHITILTLDQLLILFRKFIQVSVLKILSALYQFVNSFSLVVVEFRSIFTDFGRFHCPHHNTKTEIIFFERFEELFKSKKIIITISLAVNFL